MADKKESALGAVTDFAQARVLDASGASKKIDKATMASVLAGVKTIAPTDFNDEMYNTTNVLFVATTDANNAPFSGMIRGFLVNFIEKSYCAQIYIDCNIQRGKMYLRTRLHDGTWTTWAQL